MARTALLLLLTQGAAAAQDARVDGRVVDGMRPMGGAAVYLERIDGGEVPKMDSAGPRLDQEHLRFVPDVLVVRPGTPVSFTNSDPLMHNVFGPGRRGGDRFDLGTYPEGASRVHVFEREGVHAVLCHIHPEMVAYVLVAPVAAATTTAADGTFSLPAVEPGRYLLTAWHPRRYESFTTQEVVAGPGSTTVTLRLGSRPRDGRRED
jgi:plastocyanin